VDGVDRQWRFRNLRRSLALLAADGAAALAGVPEGCCKPDELALDFDNFQAAVVGNFADELPSDLIAALDGVGTALSGIRGDGWSGDAFRSSPEWAIVRERAGTALGLLNRLAKHNLLTG
jgi:hypothetical protein